MTQTPPSNAPLVVVLDDGYGDTHTESLALQSLAARFLPEGQSLQADGVRGTLRAGGHIGRLRWSSLTLAVEISDAHITWRLAPLLRGQLRLDTLQAAELTLTPQGEPSTEPPQPLQQLSLPLRVALPFDIQHITWAGASPIAIDGLAGSYRYDGAQHHLAVDQVSLAQGRYTLQASLQAQAPMALTAQLSGSLHQSLPGSDEAPTDGWTIAEDLAHQVDAVVDSGDCGMEPTTIVDLSTPEPEILRYGAGDPSRFEQ